MGTKHFSDGQCYPILISCEQDCLSFRCLLESDIDQSRVVMTFPELSDICAELPGEQDNLHMLVETFTVVVRDGLLDRTIRF